MARRLKKPPRSPRWETSAAKVRRVAPLTSGRKSKSIIKQLDAAIERLLRSNPRTPAGKAAKTRELRKLERSRTTATRSAAAKKGWVTRRTAARKATEKVAKQKRSAAAKAGWETRRARAVAQGRPRPGSELAAEGIISFFTGKGEGKEAIVDVLARGSDLSRIGPYWRAMGDYLAGDNDALSGFEGESIYDERARRRREFVTDPDVIREYEAYLHEDDIRFPTATESEKYKFRFMAA